MRLAAQAIVSPSGTEGQAPRPRLEPELDERAAERRGQGGLAVDPFEREALDGTGPHLIHESAQRRLHPRVAGCDQRLQGASRSARDR